MLRVLDGHSLTTKALLYPESMGLNLSERDSTATPTAGIGPEVPKLRTGDWVQDMDEPGAGIVWRVKTEDNQYNTETITYTLEHLINSLADRILPDEVKADDMGGSGGSCTAKQAAQYILGKQSDWVLGDFEYNVSNPYRFSGETLKAALETVSNSLEDPVWEYDFTVYPFKLHIRQLSDAVDSELRADRNLTTLKYTIDRTRMYTRFYPVGKNNLKPAGKYVSKNEETYGRVDKTETDQSKDTEAKLIAWANERLERHAEPLVTVTISGLDLSESTGESLDKIKISRYKCRVPLPAYSTTIIEKVTKLSWRDKIKDKESVTVTLANALADVQSIIKEAISKGGGGRRTAAELNYGIETTIGNVESGLYTRITQTAYEIRQEAHDESRSLRSIISQTAESIRLIVENDVGSLRSQITQTAESIRMEVSNEAESLRSSITQQAGRIDLVVEGDGASAAIRLSAIVDGINQSQLEFSADRVVIGSGSDKKKVKVYIDGEISATNGSITNLKTGTTKATLINSDALNGDSVTGGTVYATSQLSIGSGSSGGSGTLYYRGIQFYKQSVTMGSSPYFIEGHFLGDSNTALSLNHYHTITAEEGTGADAGKIIITLSDPVSTSDTSNHITNFKIADTTAYKNGVLSARNNVKVQAFTANAVTGTLPDHRTFTYTTDAPTPASGTSQADTWYLTGGSSWSSNKTTVYLRYGGTSGTAYAQKEISGPTPSDWQLNYQGNTSYTYKAKVKVGGTWYESGNLSAANAYDNGWSGCYGTVGLDSTTAKTLGYGESITVYAQAKATSGASSKTNVASRTITAPANNAGWILYASGPGGGHQGDLGSDSYIYISSQGTYYTWHVPAASSQSLSWTFPSAPSTGSSEPTGTFAKSYTVSMAGSNQWMWIKITVNGEEKRLKFNILKS